MGKPNEENRSLLVREAMYIFCIRFELEVPTYGCFCSNKKFYRKEIMLLIAVNSRRFWTQF